MEPPCTIPPRSPDGGRGVPETEGFSLRVLAGTLALALLAVIGGVLAFRGSVPGPAVSQAKHLSWGEMELRFRARLREAPADDGVRLRLASTLIQRAWEEAQQPCPDDPDDPAHAGVADRNECV